ncbi:UvrD-helicase domain-containing protein [Ruminiclostridium cellobioparum]|uniref:UvrD-helicase domain-containing protein n=1 Tax=Ruminiclostridium cellobioparum TaxID=29355 RepID=UPI0028AF9C68|nr:UvrD-helicase domain-containing protein [Ruminiclostridium cellobioparum]
MENKLMIAAAGSGKTTYLVNEALNIKNDWVLITTFTEANQIEIRKKIVEINGYIPSNIVVQTWFSFLLQHGVRPYQGYITDKIITGLLLVNQRSGVNYYFKGKPIYYSEDKDVDHHYFTGDYKIYSDKISKFAYRCNEKSDGAVIKRIEKIYSYLFIDEIQDLAGYDLELIKLFLKSNINVLMVGDPRQVTYHTHDESKNSKYKDGKIEEYIRTECRDTNCIIDKNTLNCSFRNNSSICEFSSKLYPEYEQCISHQTDKTDHDGIFFVKTTDVDKYLCTYEPVQLRDKSTTQVNKNFPVMNFGISKGLTFERVLIYPTSPIISWIKDIKKTLTPTSKSKFYVALTRAKYSVGIVYDFTEKTNIDGIEKY